MKKANKIEENHIKLELKIKEVTSWHKARIYVIVIIPPYLSTHFKPQITQTP
jgi:hypothetical protein